MAMSGALQTLGLGLTGLSEGLLSAPDVAQEREQKRLNLEEARLRLQKTRQEVEHPKPLVTTWGIHQYNPETGQWDYTPTPHDTKDAPQVARLKYITTLLQSADPQEQELGKAELSKTQAPGIQAKARQEALGLQRQKIQDQARHWRALEAQAKARNDINARHFADMAKHYEDLADNYEQMSADRRYGIDTRSEDTRYGIETRDDAVDRQIASREQQQSARLAQALQVHEERLKARADEVDKRLAAAQATKDARAIQQAEHDKAALERQRERLEWERDKLAMQLEFKTPGEEARTADTRNRTLERISGGERKEEEHQQKMLTASERLKQLETKGKYLDERQQAELKRLQEQAKQLEAAGPGKSTYLDLRVQKLEESMEQARNREQRAAQKEPLVEQDIRGRIKGREGSKNEVTIQDGMTIHRLRGKDVDLFQGILARMTGNKTKDAALVQGLPRQHDRLIGRLAYLQKYQQALPAETGPVPTEEPTPQAPVPGQLSEKELTSELRKIGIPEPETPAAKLVEDFMMRLKKMPQAEAEERYKRLTDTDQKQAFKIAFLDVYKRRPPE